MKNRIQGIKAVHLIIIYFTILAFIQGYLSASVEGSRNYRMRQTGAEVKIDGVLDEEVWQEAIRIDLPYEVAPGENIPAPVKTECLMCYNRTEIYIAFRCYDPEYKRIRAHLMDRDSGFTMLQDDHVMILIDTFNDERRCFEFRINALGVQADGIYSEVEDYEDLSWDAIWKSAGKILDWGYVIEVGIPFNQLRFPKSKTEQIWGFSFERSYPRKVRHKTGSHPRDRNRSCGICQLNKISGFKNISPGRRFELVPTFTVNRTDKQAEFPNGDMIIGETGIEPGISGRWGIASNLILSAAVNPDFSHVEADAAQLEINTRFALRYPEKRPFFLEGVDYFLTPLEAVFTRTVFDPLWGIKLTGKIGKDYWGVFFNHDRYNNLIFPGNQGSQSTSLQEDIIGGVFRYRRDIGKGSTLGILYTGRTGVNDDYYNHTGGIDGFLRLSRTKSLGFQYLRTQTRYPFEIAINYDQPQDSFGGSGLLVKLSHTGRNLWYNFSYNDLNGRFRADYGFIPRVDVRLYSGSIQPIIWGKPGGWFDSIFFKLAGEYLTDRQGNLAEQNLQLGVTYQGPLQTVLQPNIIYRRELYNGVIYDQTEAQAYAEIKPVGGMKYYLLAEFGDAIDYVNSRPADACLISPGLELGIGRHFNISLSHTFEHLSHDGKKIYSANLLQARLVYNFNLKTFIRTIIQFMDIRRNLDMYSVSGVSAEPRTSTLFTQILFSYKVNPQTVLFVGYSDNQLGLKGIDLTRTDRTFFLKIGYALGF